MKIIFVGGGTAGHVNPALALADYIREQDPQVKILYVGTKDGMEKKLVARAKFPFEGITVSGFSRKINFESLKKNINTIKNIITATFESKKILENFKPDICIGTGGYVCGPFLRKAAKMNIPFLIHDSNSYPGVTTKLLANKTRKMLLVDEAAEKHLPSGSKTVITGNPVRSKILTTAKNEAKKELGIDPHHLVILSFGGSLGARAINDVMQKIIINHKDDSNYTFIHGFGKNNHEFKHNLENNNIDVKKDSRIIIKEYIKNMPECMAAADLVICRSGAITLSELKATATPAILIPSPNVAENHQYHNAMALVNANAASIIEEKNLNEETLWNEIQKILGNNQSVAKAYSENLKKIAVTDASQKIYEIIKDIVEEQEEI